MQKYLYNGLNTCGLLTMLYLFLLGLTLMGDSLKVIGKDEVKELFENLSNPVSGLIVGILVTVLVQSSSTSTSLVVALVGNESISVRTAIPVIMGANIGTSITNTLVSIASMENKDELKRAFSGSTVHDIFNLLSVICLLPLEVIFHILERLTEKMVENLEDNSASTFESPIGKIVKPLSKHIISVDKSALELDCEGKCDPLKSSMLDDTSLSSEAKGGVILALSLLILCVSLYSIVKILHKLVKGHLRHYLKKALNMPDIFAMALGTALTILVQSSSITTSTLVPLVGLDVIQLEKMYVITLGCNVGTTVTALLAALVVATVPAIQIALCHLFFNVFGILIWYPIPYLRRIPVRASKILGNIAKINRAFVVWYIVIAFVASPLFILLLSWMIEQEKLGPRISGILLAVLSLLACAYGGRRVSKWYAVQIGGEDAAMAADRITEPESAYEL